MTDIVSTVLMFAAFVLIYWAGYQDGKLHAADAADPAAQGRAGRMRDYRAIAAPSLTSAAFLIRETRDSSKFISLAMSLALSPSQ